MKDPRKEWLDTNMNQMCENLEKSSKVPFMTNKNTREVEESRKKFGRFYTQINPPVQENEWGEKEAFGSDDIENFWIDVLHQELQKARREMLHKLYLCAIGKYEGDALENVKAQIAEYQSELDQPTI